MRRQILSRRCLFLLASSILGLASTAAAFGGEDSAREIEIRTDAMWGGSVSRWLVQPGRLKVQEHDTLSRILRIDDSTAYPRLLERARALRSVTCPDFSDGSRTEVRWNGKAEEVRQCINCWACDSGRAAGWTAFDSVWNAFKAFKAVEPTVWTSVTRGSAVVLETGDSSEAWAQDLRRLLAEDTGLVVPGPEEIAREYPRCKDFATLAGRRQQECLVQVLSEGDAGFLLLLESQGHDIDIWSPLQRRLGEAHPLLNGWSRRRERLETIVRASRCRRVLGADCADSSGAQAWTQRRFGSVVVLAREDRFEGAAQELRRLLAADTNFSVASPEQLRMAIPACGRTIGNKCLVALMEDQFLSFVVEVHRGYGESQGPSFRVYSPLRKNLGCTNPNGCDRTPPFVQDLAVRERRLRALIASTVPRPWMPLSLGLWERTSFPDVDRVRGLALALPSSELKRLDGIGVGMFQLAKSGIHGQVGLVNVSDGVALLQVGLINADHDRDIGHSQRSFLQVGAFGVSTNQTGLQLNLVNWGENQRGVQAGLWNRAQQQRGLQLGLYNCAERLTGVQIGLLNRAKSGGLLPWMPLFNVGWAATR